MKCVRKIFWFEKLEKCIVNCEEKEDKGKGISFLICEILNVFFGKYKIRVVYYV